jgi:hypothetical protein
MNSLSALKIRREGKVLVKSLESETPAPETFPLNMPLLYEPTQKRVVANRNVLLLGKH